MTAGEPRVSAVRAASRTLEACKTQGVGSAVSQRLVGSDCKGDVACEAELYLAIVEVFRARGLRAALGARDLREIP